MSGLLWKAQKKASKQGCARVKKCGQSHGQSQGKSWASKGQSPQNLGNRFGEGLPRPIFCSTCVWENGTEFPLYNIKGDQQLKLLGPARRARRGLEFEQRRVFPAALI